MHRFLIILFLLSISFHTLAQQVVEQPLPTTDTTRLTLPVIPESELAIPSLETPLFLNALTTPQHFNAPVFDINKYLKSNWKVEYQSFTGSNPNFGYSPGSYFMVSPFLHSAAIFNQASYRLSDKVTFGGNSFGVNSIFAAPLPHPSANQWETKGASMFLQYKVNRNLKIETRISVSGHQNKP